MAERLFVMVFSIAVSSAKIIDFRKDIGAVPEKNDKTTYMSNGKLLGDALSMLQPGDVFVVPNMTFHVMGGIEVDNLNSVTVQIDGTIKYSNDQKAWPRIDGKVKECLSGKNWNNVTLTSSHEVGNFGTFDGSGGDGMLGGWWGPPGIGYALLGENRPRLIAVDHGKDILVEKIFFKNSPYWTFWFTNVDGLEVRHSKIDARRTKADSHTIIDMTAFNTDGFDVTGRNVWIHDSEIWNQDDCIAVKDANPSENMVFERIQASGIGLAIGSIGAHSHIRNITFRDIYMHHTWKGIYSKFRYFEEEKTSIIEDVTYENIVMDEPSQFPIWIGPAQQADSKNACSILWPKTGKCPMAPGGIYRNLVFRNITINSPQGGPGVLIGSVEHPIENLVFEDVMVKNPAKGHWGFDYYVAGIDNSTCVAKGRTSPVPKGCKDETKSSLIV